MVRLSSMLRTLHLFSSSLSLSVLGIGTCVLVFASVTFRWVVTRRAQCFRIILVSDTAWFADIVLWRENCAEDTTRSVSSLVLKFVLCGRTSTVFFYLLWRESIHDVVHQGEIIVAIYSWMLRSVWVRTVTWRDNIRWMKRIHDSQGNGALLYFVLFLQCVIIQR